MAIAGIDLSLTSPALCVYTGSDDFCIENCVFHYMADSAKRLIDNNQFRGIMYPSYTTQIERYENISLWLIKCLMEYRIEKVFIEDYSYGSTGRVFHIAENTGILKYHLFKYHFQIETIPPTVIKKIATGKGNANKEAMQTSFIEETGYDLKKMLSLTEKQWNPSSDLIDSYYVCKYGSLGYKKDTV